MQRRSFPFLLLLACLALPSMPARAESRIEKSFRLDPGGEFRLDTDLGRVSVAGRPTPGARVLITSKRRNLEHLLRFRFEQGARSVTISAKKKRLFESWFGLGSASIHFEIQVPEQTRLSVDTSGGGITVSGMRSTAKLETSGGPIEVRDFVGDLEGDTSGGPIRLRDIRGRTRVETSGGGIEGIALDGPVSADTSGGSIRLDQVSGDINAHSSGGGIHIKGAGGRIQADTSGGGIEASFTRGNGRGGSLESSGGGITVSVDPEVGLEIDAEGNSVRTDLPIRILGEVSRRRLHGSLGRGGETLRLRTSGGSVRIQPLSLR